MILTDRDRKALRSSSNELGKIIERVEAWQRRFGELDQSGDVAAAKSKLIVKIRQLDAALENSRNGA